MGKMLSCAGVAAVALAALLTVEPPARACLPPPPEELALKSEYSRDWLVPGARRVSLSLTLDPSGTGSGTLTLDPNIQDEWGSTQIALDEIPVTVRLVRDEASAAKGRRLYELTRFEPDGKPASGKRWLLVRPVKAGSPCWLVFAGKDGKARDVLVLQ